MNYELYLVSHGFRLLSLPWEPIHYRQTVISTEVGSEGSDATVLAFDEVKSDPNESPETRDANRSKGADRPLRVRTESPTDSDFSPIFQTILLSLTNAIMHYEL